MRIKDLSWVTLSDNVSLARLNQGLWVAMWPVLSRVSWTTRLHFFKTFSREWIVARTDPCCLQYSIANQYGADFVPSAELFSPHFEGHTFSKQSKHSWHMKYRHSQQDRGSHKLKRRLSIFITQLLGSWILEQKVFEGRFVMWWHMHADLWIKACQWCQNALKFKLFADNKMKLVITWQT